MSLFVLSLVLFFFFHGCSALGPEEEVVFSYDESTGNGPSRWSQLDSSWSLCGSGKRQSPISIDGTNSQLQTNLGNLQTSYKPATANLQNRGFHIQINWNGDAGNVIIEGTTFKLMETHWHAPSEHKLDGISYEMELHHVHKNDAGQRAVIGILYENGPPDPFLSELVSPLLSLQNGRDVDLGIVNPRDIDGFNGKYYRYKGSLTTPPCTEDVTWTILNQVKTVSSQQVQRLKAAMDKGDEENARPTQPLNGRPVFKNA